MINSEHKTQFKALLFHFTQTILKTLADYYCDIDYVYIYVYVPLKCYMLAH